MAVTVEELGISLRLEAVTDAQTAILTRLLGVGEAHVALLIPDAPPAIQDEVVVRLASYLHDAPVGRRDSYANAWVFSGAGALAARFKPQAASGSVVTPGIVGATGLTLREVNALIETHTELAEAHHIPGTGSTGLSESEVAARIETHKELSEAHHRRSSIAGIVNVENGRLASSTGTVMRIGWSESQAYDEQVFTRDGNHPDDGAAVGTIAGVFPPVQPAGLPDIPDVSTSEKYLHIWVGEIPGNIAQLTFFGSPAHGVSTAEAQTYNTTEGTWWRTNLPLSQGISAYAFSATVVGALIASQAYVDAAIAAIPVSPGGGAPTYTLLATDTAATASQFIFSGSERVAFRAAWNGGTYRGFVIEVTTVTATADEYYQYQIVRRADAPDIPTTKSTQFNFDDVAIGVGNSVNLFHSSTFLLVQGVSGHWPSGAECRIYGVS